jgi:hypothetical protein
MKTQFLRVVLAGVLGCAFAALAVGGEIVASNYVSVGYGVKASGWCTNETASANIPTTAPNPGNSFTVGDFRFWINIGKFNWSSVGPIFSNRVLQNGSDFNCRSDKALVVVKAQYIGTNPVYANTFRLNVDQISIYTYYDNRNATTNELWWSETTMGNEGVSASVFPHNSRLSGTASEYTKLEWNPPDTAAQDVLTMTRTFCLPQDRWLEVDGFEIVCNAQVERRATPREAVVRVASTNFSIGWGHTGAWRTNETAAANTPVTAPNPGGSFTLGDFRFTILSVGGAGYGSVGPSFTGRTLANGGAYCGNWKAMAPSIKAEYVGSQAKPTTAFRLNIDQISIYGASDGGLGSTNSWIETTSGNAATSPPVAMLAGVYRFGNNEATASTFTQISWNPAEKSLSFDGTANMTRTFTYKQSPGGNPVLVDGFEIIGSAELLGPASLGTLVTIR